MAIDRMYRQGDVLLVAVDGVPPGASSVGRDGGRLVLAYGEATGHAHTIESDHAALLATGPGVFLDVRGPEPVMLVHQEHESIAVDPGTYRVVRQREYTPRAAPQWVAD